MGEVRTSTRVLIVSAIALLVILLTGPMGYKYELLELQPSLVSVVVALAGGALISLVAFVYLVIAFRGDGTADRVPLIIAILMGLVPAFFIMPQMMKADSLPQIHDITTDTENPPAFVALKDARDAAPNGADYGAAFEDWPAEKIASATIESYPAVQPIYTNLSVGEAVARANEVMLAMGMEVVAVDEESGSVEGTATTFWFGFKDDFVVRVVAEEEGSRVDVRSMSRVGKSDIGKNADRILMFTAGFGS